MHLAPVPAESGGVPDPFALLETVRRARIHGDTPRVLVLSVADDPTGTCPAPEQLYEVCEAAADEGLWVISDETRRDLLHDPHDTVLLSPAEMLPDGVVVLTDLRDTLVPASWPAALARFPGTDRGAVFRDAVLDALAAVPAPLPGPLGCAVTHALGEPEEVRARTATVARVYGALAAALHHTVTEAGAVCRPPSSGSHLYADFEPLRRPLGARGSWNRTRWKGSWHPGRRAAGTASVTSRVPCGYGSVPRRCWAPARSSGGTPWRPPIRWNSRTSPRR